MAAPVTVLKFGSSVLSDRSRLPSVVHDIYRAVRRGHRVIAVVSAIGRHTDLLMAKARYIADTACCDIALAKLLGTGEEQSAALLTLAVRRAGIPCTMLEAETLDLIVQGERLDADPYALNRGALERALGRAPVAIVPGFIGRHEQGGPAVMGRGGSDLTAVFLAEQLQAQRCRLVKDVDGIYEHDPADTTLETAPRLFAEVTCEDALRVADVLVQPKAVEYLHCTHRTAEVTSLLHDQGTTVGAARSRLAHRPPYQPLKIAISGLGTAGEGVYRHLDALPTQFEIVAIGVNETERARDVTSTPLYREVDELPELDYDVLLELSGDTESAHARVQQSLRQGRSVVTDNERLAARHGVFLAEVAAHHGADFRYSAAVGGAAPMLELVEQVQAIAPIDEIRGVLNGTCNYVFDRMADGLTLDAAVCEAQANGFAEADPERDLSGANSIDKLRLLARAAWGADISDAPIVCEGIADMTREQLIHAAKKHRRVRLVASMNCHGRGVVQPVWLPQDDELARVAGAGNALLIRTQGGQQYFTTGLGAGRWPTAEAVLADLIDIRHRPGAPNDAMRHIRGTRRPAMPDIG